LSVALLADHHRVIFSLYMTNFERAQLELTESQLTSIGEKINHWSNKDKVISLMRYRYCKEEAQAA
tara:strand:- start:331 stop:528 length:198 start_codon:yes stop_codon:yes gene_type:complete